MKERLGIRLNDEDLKMLILVARRDGGQYEMRPRTHVDAPLINRERPRSDERAPLGQGRGNFDYRKKRKECQDSGCKSDVQGGSTHKR